MAPIAVDGLGVDDVTIDGDVVDEITMDGDVVYQAVAIPDSVENHLDTWYSIDEGSGTSLADSFNELPATLQEGDWVSDEQYWGDYGVNTSPDYYLSDSTIEDLSTFSLCAWVVPQQSGDETPLFGLSEGSPPEGRSIGFNVVMDGGNFWSLSTTPSNTTSGSNRISYIQDELYFVAASSTGNDSALHVWDIDTKVETTTDSPNDPDFSDSRFNGGDGDAIIAASGLNLGTELSESDFEEIWEDTRP